MEKGVIIMKKIFFAATFLALVMIAPLPTMAQVNIGISFGLPSPIGFAAPPEVIVLPETDNVYAVPGIDVDLFFWNGWWWRPWEGRWYRSRYYDRGWGYYNNVPSFYYDVDPRWRGHYRDRNWYGHRWDHKPIRYQQLRQNWQNWHNNRHWERQATWNVQGYRTRPPAQRQELRRQREREYYQRPEVQRHRQVMQQQQRQPQGKVQPEGKFQRPPTKIQQEQQQQRMQPQGRPEGGRGDRRR